MCELGVPLIVRHQGTLFAAYSVHVEHHSPLAQHSYLPVFPCRNTRRLHIFAIAIGLGYKLSDQLLRPQASGESGNAHIDPGYDRIFHICRRCSPRHRRWACFRLGLYCDRAQSIAAGRPTRYALKCSSYPLVDRSACVTLKGPHRAVADLPGSIGLRQKYKRRRAQGFTIVDFCSPRNMLGLCFPKN